MGASLEERRAFEREEFLEKVAQGIAVIAAAFAVGWTPAQLKRELLDPGFGELVDYAEQRNIDAVEEALYRKAKEGEGWAVQMVLFNRRPDRWKDRRQVHVQQDTTISVAVTRSVVAGVAELLDMDIAALQPGGALDRPVIDAEEIEDADVIERG